MSLGLACRDWLLNLARIEAESGCPRLFGMKSEIATYFADISADWEPEQRYHLMSACVKRLFDNNYGFAPIPWTEEEKAAWAFWDYPYLGHWRTPGKPHVEITWASTGNRTVIDANKVNAAYRYEEFEFGKSKLNKKLLKSTVREFMQRTFGAPEEFGPLWRYRSHAPGLIITTNLDFGGRHPSQLRYSQWIHQIESHGVEPCWVLDHGGISALLGWPQTEWCYLKDADIPAAADLLVRLCKEFVDAVPGMWERSGLSWEIPAG
jgi:hypothetical protein